MVESVTMSMQQKHLLVTVLLLAAVVAWTGCSRSKHSQASHAEIAGPAAVKADANQLPGTIVTPHLECEITPGKNVLWCATFQIAWNKLYDLLGGPIQWPDAPEMVNILNRRPVTRRDLDEASYVVVAGWTTNDSNDIRQKIAPELNRRFKGAASPELPPRLDSVPPQRLISYTYLFRELPFQRAFDRMRRAHQFNGRPVESFGIFQLLPEDKSEAKMAEQVLVYDFRGEDDFIIELKTQSKSDRLILAKIPASPTLAETVKAVQSRLAPGAPHPMQQHADLFIPVIDFDVLRNYKELTGKGSLLEMALQQIRFKLTERGAVLRSEAAIVAKAMSLRNLVFDKPFLVMLQRTDVSQPYFALWVANAELLVPFHETSSKTSSFVK
jgi:hypothetical protein